MLGGKDVFLLIFEKDIVAMLGSESGERILEIDCRLEELQQEFLLLVNGKKDYGNIADEIHKL